MNVETIRLEDLRAQHRPISAGLIDAVLEALGECDPIRGVAVARFEAEFAEVCGVPHVIGCASGTDALTLVVRALELPPASEVLVSALAPMGVASAVRLAGAEAVFVDVDPRTGMLDPSALVAAASPETRAVVASHARGDCAPMAEVVAVARAHDWTVIEDATDAVGARLEDRPVGSLGDVACFDFSPDRAFGAFGDAGAIATADPQLAVRLRVLGDLGRSGGDLPARVGMQSRLDTIQAKILRSKLPLLESWIATRTTIAAEYTAAFADSAAIDLPAGNLSGTSAHSAFVIRVADRDRCIARFAAAGVEASADHAGPLPHDHDERQSFSAARAWVESAVRIPIRPELLPAMREQVIAATLGVVESLTPA